LPAALERCVRHVKAKGQGVKNAWAVCRGSMGSDAEIAARAKKKRMPTKPTRY
jgi:hypothetical protein